MRFKQFLAESSDNFFDFEEVVKKIKTDCSHYLSDSGDKPLYRGIRSAALMDAAKSVYSQAPVNRRPKDSGKGFNLMFNAGYELAFDYPTIRSSCVYATGSSVTAKQYGPLYYFFPAGDYAFTYSPEFEDSYESSSNMYEELNKDFRAKTSLKLTHYELQYIFDAISDYFTPSQFIKNKQEVNRVMAKSLYHFGYYDRVEDKIDFHSILCNSMKRLFKDTYIDSKELSRGIKLQHEIGFYQFDGYYAVPLAEVWEAIMNDDHARGSFNHLTPGELKHHPGELYPYLLQRIKSA